MPRNEQERDDVKIFLSYRRDDSAAITGRIYDRLTAQFGRNAVFMDVDVIPFGVDFREHIREALSQCRVFLAVIDANWITAGENSVRRLDDPADFVRIELEMALGRKMPVIPVLVGQTPMPRPAELPTSLRELSYRNAARLDLGLDFQVHMNRLIRHLKTLDSGPFGSPQTTPVPPAQPEARYVSGAIGATVTLRVQSPSGNSGSLAFDASEDRRIIIGRSEACDVRLPEELHASRKHAIVLYDCDYGWCLQDLQSANGVYLNGNRTKEAAIKVGDQIRIGKTEIIVERLTP